MVNFGRATNAYVQSVVMCPLALVVSKIADLLTWLLETLQTRPILCLQLYCLGMEDGFKTSCYSIVNHSVTKKQRT